MNIDFKVVGREKKVIEVDVKRYVVEFTPEEIVALRIALGGSNSENNYRHSEYNGSLSLKSYQVLHGAINEQLISYLQKEGLINGD